MVTTYFSSQILVLWLVMSAKSSYKTGPIWKLWTLSLKQASLDQNAAHTLLHLSTGERNVLGVIPPKRKHFGTLHQVPPDYLVHPFLLMITVLKHTHEYL